MLKKQVHVHAVPSNEPSKPSTAKTSVAEDPRHRRAADRRIGSSQQNMTSLFACCSGDPDQPPSLSLNGGGSIPSLGLGTFQATKVSVNLLPRRRRSLCTQCVVAKRQATKPPQAIYVLTAAHPFAAE